MSLKKSEGLLIMKWYHINCLSLWVLYIDGFRNWLLLLYEFQKVWVNLTICKLYI